MRLIQPIAVQLSILALLLIAASDRAQSPVQSSTNLDAQKDEQLITCPVFVAWIQIEVTNTQGEEVADLGKDDFVIYEDGVKQTMEFWQRNGSERQTDQPMYEAGYWPTNYQFRGEWRKIRVTVRDQITRKLKVRSTPKGYYADKELQK